MSNNKNFCSQFNKLCSLATNTGECLSSVCVARESFSKPKTVGDSFVNLIGWVDSLTIEKQNLLEDLLFILRSNNIQNCTEICDGDCTSCNSSYKNFHWRHKEYVEEVEF